MKITVTYNRRWIMQHYGIHSDRGNYQPPAATPRSLTTAPPRYKISAANALSLPTHSAMTRLRRHPCRLACRCPPSIKRPPRNRRHATSRERPPKVLPPESHNLGDSENPAPDPAERQTGTGNQTAFRVLETPLKTDNDPPRSQQMALNLGSAVHKPGWRIYTKLYDAMLILDALNDAPDTSGGGSHAGVECPWEMVTTGFCSPICRIQFANGVKACTTGLQAIASNRAIAGLLQPLEIPTARGERIKIDFITKN
jgi:hypothetical protein